MGELEAMGYSLQFRTSLLRSSMTGYTRVLGKVQRGETTRNRKGSATLTTRRFRRLVGNTEWFRQDQETTDADEIMPPWIHQRNTRPKTEKAEPDRRHIECLMFIPYTPNSALRNKLTQGEALLEYRTRTKFVEKMGSSLREMLVKADPDPQPCGRDDCFPCRSTPGACMRQNGLYSIECETCRQNEKTSLYIGESARTLYDRGLEHQKAYASRSEESVMHEHEQNDHQGEKAEWTMKAQGFPKGNLKRQALEAHKISLNEDNNLLNRRGEWGQNLPPKT